MKKKFIIVCFMVGCFGLVGCGSSPDFTKDNLVEWKNVHSNSKAYYELKGSAINGVFNHGFTADQDFARVGDTIKLIDGKIIVIKGNK